MTNTEDKLRGEIFSAVSALIEAEREACAKLVETLVLSMGPHKYPSGDERYLMEITEAGCRGAFADAIRARPNR